MATKTGLFPPGITAEKFLGCNRSHPCDQKNGLFIAFLEPSRCARIFSAIRLIFGGRDYGDHFFASKSAKKPVNEPAGFLLVPIRPTPVL